MRALLLPLKAIYRGLVFFANSPRTLMLSAPESPAGLAIAGIAERLDAMRPAGPVRVASPLAIIRS